MNTKSKSGFSSSLGFILVATGSAVGVGNIWRFPYLAAQNGGGIFLIIYLLLVLTFGFTLLTTDIAIGRRTREKALNAFGAMKSKWKFLGKLTFLVPLIIMTYYCVIGGWVLKYATVYLSGCRDQATQDDYFKSFLSSHASPIVFTLIFMAITVFIVYFGVQKGIERFAKVVMPGLILMIVGIAVFSLTLRYTDSNGIERTGMQGLMIYLKPDFTDMTFSKFLKILLDAMSQLFFSLSVSMGIMVTYGSYVKKDTNLSRSIKYIEYFDTGVALLAGVMVIPAVYVFYGTQGMTSGPGLMFVSMPKVFNAMGNIGTIIGFVFFAMVTFATLTSSISVMETLVADFMDLLHMSRKKTSLILGVVYSIASIIICLGYNVFYFEFTLPNGQSAQLLDIMDYVSNSFLLPLISFLTCVFVGWIIKPKWIIDEVEASGDKFSRKRLYNVMIRYIAPVVMTILFFQSTGIL